MGYIKKLKNNELVGGTDKHTIYPVTSTEAVFEEITNGNESSFKSQKTINGEHDDRIKGLEEEVPGAIKSITINGGSKTYLPENGNVELTIYSPGGEDYPGIAEAVQTNADNITTIQNEIGTDTTEDTISGRIKSLENAVGTGGSVDQRISNAIGNINAEHSDMDPTDHIQYQIIQSNGEITDLTIQGVDIASADALEALRQTYEGLSRTDIIIQNTAPTTGNEGVIYRVTGETTYTDYMFYNGQRYTMATYDIGNLDPQVSYYACATPAATPAKAATGTDASAYALTLGGHFKVEMDEANTATSGVTLQVGSAAAKELMYNGATVDADNTWEDGEVIAVYYYNNKYWASNAQGGGGKAEKIKYDNSASGLAAKNVQGALDEVSDELYTESNYPFELGSIDAADGQDIVKTDGTRIRTVGYVPKSTNKINLTVTRSCNQVNIILYNNGVFAESVQGVITDITAGTYVYDVDTENSWDSYRIVCFTSGYTSQNLDGNYSVGYSSFKNNVLRNYPIIQDNSESDFDIADKRNYVIARFENGHLRTKNFNSAATPKIASIDGSDLSISDGNGYAIALFKDGHLKTKNFNSKDLINYVQYSELKGKRVVFVGDSFTQGNELPDSSKVYCNVFAEVSGCTTVNLGVAGSSIAKRANNAARFYTRCTASNLAGADLIIVQGGTNDFDLDSKAIGDLFDYVDTTPVDYFGGKTIVAPSDTEAFGGAMHQLIQTIRTNAPRVPIVFVTPTNRGTYGHSRLPTSYEYNKNMNTMQEFRDAMEKICEFYQIPVFKAHLIPQLDFTNEAISLAYSVGDNLHPNATGNDVLGKALYKFIMNNITLN